MSKPKPGPASLRMTTNHSELVQVMWQSRILSSPTALQVHFEWHDLCTLLIYKGAGPAQGKVQAHGLVAAECQPRNAHAAAAERGQAQDCFRNNMTSSRRRTRRWRSRMGR